MYEVWQYDEQLGSFLPVRQNGKRLGFDGWDEAQNARIELALSNPDKQYKVEYATIRRRRKGR